MNTQSRTICIIGACGVECTAPSAIRLWRWLQSSIAPGLRLAKVPLSYFTGSALLIQL